MEGVFALLCLLAESVDPLRGSHRPLRKQPVIYKGILVNMADCMYRIVIIKKNLLGKMWHILVPSPQVQRVVKWAFKAEPRPAKLLVTSGSCPNGLGDGSDVWRAEY